VSSNDISIITKTLKAYQDALNASNASVVNELYTSDGVFMPQNFPTIVGTEAIRETYKKIFSAITLSVEFNIIEVVPITAEWAFARTSSTGTQLVKANGVESAEANQELFVMQKVGGEWKIARYCFATTNPPH